MNIFDMIGPVMVGPSSSHTAGAARAGYVARMLLGEEPAKAVVTLSGSFARTYQGHGTDRAIIGGILGFSPSDLHIRNSFEEAKKKRLCYTFRMEDLENASPNTAKIELQGANGSVISTIISSVGGGVVQVVRINDADVQFSAEYPTTVIFNDDKPGIVAKVSEHFADHHINIAFMRLFRKAEGQEAIMVIESDQKVGAKILEALRQCEHINKVISIEPF